MPVFSSHLLEYKDLKLGERIRAERQRQGITLRELSARTKLSIALLSMIENERHVLDVRQAESIARGLGIPLESFFPAELSLPYQIMRESKVRAGQARQAIVVPRGGGSPERHRHAFWPLAERFVGRQMEPQLGRIEPVSEDELQFCYHHDEEFAFVLKGKIEFLLRTPRGTERTELSRGDCVYFNSSLPHCFRSLGDGPSESLHLLSSASAPIQTGWDWVSPRRVGLVREDDGELERVKLIGKELSFLRAASGWTLEEASRHAGISERHLEQIERGSKPVSMEVMLKLARAFGRTPRQLLGLTSQCDVCYSVQRSSDLRLIPPRERRSPAGSKGNGSSRFYSLAREFPKRRMFPYWVRVPNLESQPLAVEEHHGQEFIYVLDGELELTTYVGERVVKELLRAGDSCYLDSTVPHCLRGHTRNPYSETSAEILTVFWCPLGEAYLFED